MNPKWSIKQEPEVKKSYKTYYILLFVPVYFVAFFMWTKDVYEGILSTDILSVIVYSLLYILTILSLVVSMLAVIEK